MYYKKIFKKQSWKSTKFPPSTAFDYFFFLGSYSLNRYQNCLDPLFKEVEKNSFEKESFMSQ